MAAAIGSLFSPGGAGIIYIPTVKIPVFTPTAPQQPTTRPRPVPSVFTVPPPTDIGGNAPKSVPLFTMPLPVGGIGDAPPAAGAPTATGSTTGTQTGSTGTSDTSRLLDMIASAFQPQSLAPSVGPTGVTDTSTVQPTAGTTSPMTILIVVIALGGGLYWYMKHKKKGAAA